jgi:DNA/RNA endonuclease YhcR with UshA esterase domain
MKMNIRSLMAAAFAAALIAAPQASFGADKSKPPVINSSDKKSLASKIGKEVSVEGLVQSTGKGDNDRVRFLNLSSQQGTGFVAAVFPAAYKKLGPIGNYENKNVRVTGTLEKYNKQTQIKVFKASQIKALTTPAPAAKKKK